MTSPARCARWDFRVENQRWTWQRVVSDNPPTSAQCSHATLGIAISDAMKHGFTPATEKFLIDDVYTVTYLEPGELPQILSKRAP